MASVIVEDVPRRAHRARSRFYVGIALLITVIVFAGFAPSMAAIFLRGEPRPWILHVHAAVYVGWLALLIAQTVLAARGRIALHRRIGSFGIAYAVVVMSPSGIGRNVIARSSVHSPACTWSAGTTKLTIRPSAHLPVLLGMGYDFVSRRRIHPVYWIGVAAMTLALARIPLAETEIWRRVGRALLTPLL